MIDITFIHKWTVFITFMSRIINRFNDVGTSILHFQRVAERIEFKKSITFRVVNFRLQYEFMSTNQTTTSLAAIPS